MSPSSEHPYGRGTPSQTEIGHHYLKQDEARRAQRRAQKPRPSGGGKSNPWGVLIVIFIVFVGLKAMVSDDESEDQVQPSEVQPYTGPIRPFTGPLRSWEGTGESTTDHDLIETLPDNYERFWTMPEEQAGATSTSTEQATGQASIDQMSFSVECILPDGSGKVLNIYIVDPAPGEGPSEREEARIWREYRAKLPEDVRESIRKIYKLARREGVSFPQLLEYSFFPEEGNE